MFQVFIPGLQTNRDEALRQAGLGDLVPDAFWCEVSSGPEGMAGSVAGWRPLGQTTRIGFYPEVQRWLPAVPDGDLIGGRYWVGFWDHEKISPGLLARREQLAGNRLDLTGDGSMWLVPDVNMLPQVMRYTDQGMMLQVREQYRPLANAAAEWGQRIAATVQAQQEGRDVPGWSMDECFRFCAMALRHNYSLTTEVISEAGLISTDNVRSIIYAVLGIGGAE